MPTDDKRFGTGRLANDPETPSKAPQPGPPFLPVGPGGQKLTPVTPAGTDSLPQGLSLGNALKGDMPKGRLRWDDEVRRAGLSAPSVQYDAWIRSRTTDPYDPEYTAIVVQEKVAANKREAALRAAQEKEQAENAKKVKAVPWLPGKAPVGASPQVPGGLSTGEEHSFDVNAKKQAAEQASPVEFVDVEGKPIDPDKSTVSTLKPGGQSAGTANEEEGDVTISDGEFIANGGAVWVGDANVTTGAHTVLQGRYRAAADMMNDVFRWNPAQTAAFQTKVGLEPTGVADEDTVAFWKWVINTGRYYTAMGQHRTVDSIVQQGSAQVSGRGGGGGGGGGGGAAIPADAAKRLLNEAMKEFAGREATDDELKQFLPAVRASAGSTDFDATQFATDWVRGGSEGARSSEVASYQAATDYYAVVQQLIGGQ